MLARLHPYHTIRVFNLLNIIRHLTFMFIYAKCLGTFEYSNGDDDDRDDSGREDENNIERIWCNIGELDNFLLRFHSSVQGSNSKGRNTMPSQISLKQNVDLI